MASIPSRREGGHSMSLVERLFSRTSPRASNSGSTAGQLVYAIGDVHGRYDLLRDLLAQLTRDYSVQARGRRPIVIFCGDYIDRGPQSFEVIEALVWLQQHAHVEVRMLKGNHEQALLNFIGEPESGRAWLELGGAATLRAYGVSMTSAGDAGLDLVRVKDALLASLPASHLRLLDALELMIVVGDYVFVHAGIRPGRPLAQQTERDLLWIREDFTAARGPFEKIVVHGHSWRSDEPEILATRIGLDTGAYDTGVLTAVRLDDGQLAVLQARDAPAAPRDPWAVPKELRP